MSITLRRCETTAQSLRSLAEWAEGRGPGEELSTAVREVLDALRDQRDVTITIGGT